MKFTSKQLMMVALFIGIGLIVFAVLNATLDFSLDEKLGNDISTYGMLGGLGILFWSRKVRTQEEADARSRKEEDNEAANSVDADTTV